MSCGFVWLRGILEGCEGTGEREDAERGVTSTDIETEFLESPTEVVWQQDQQTSTE